MVKIVDHMATDICWSILPYLTNKEGLSDTTNYPPCIDNLLTKIPMGMWHMHTDVTCTHADVTYTEMSHACKLDFYNTFIYPISAIIL